MTPNIKGLHHFTAIAGNPTENAKFYVKVLGLRMVKKTVNHDAPQVYHLFYGDYEGTPGSSITFFPGMTDQEGKDGAGMVTELGLRVPENSLEYWKKRLENQNVRFEQEEWYGKESLAFEDPDGISLRLVTEDSNSFKTWAESSVTEENQIRGMNHVKLSISKPEKTERLLEQMGLHRVEDDYFEAEDSSGVRIEETSQPGRTGKGSVHHIAFKAGDEEEQKEWREKIKRQGLRPSPTISRKYFTSFYFREHGGVLFEFSTTGPGYTADESVEQLGSSLVLPENLQNRREQIEAALPEFNEDEIR